MVHCHLLVSESVGGELFHLGTGYGQSRLRLKVGEVVTVQVVLEQWTSPVDVEADALKHRALLQFAQTVNL